MMINLYFVSDKAFVWNAEDASVLRKEHHIVGSLVGFYPIKPFQVQSKWLPLQLMPEETKLLTDKGIAQLVSSPDKITDAAFVEHFHTKRDQLCEEQILLLKENRKKQILEKADQIYEGKKRKLLGDKDKKKRAKTQDISHTIVEDSSKDDELSSEAKKCEENLIMEDEKDPDKNAEEDSSDKGLSEEVDEKLKQTEEEEKKLIIEAELAKVPDVEKELCMVQLFTECPWKGSGSVAVNWKYPSTDMEKIRCAVFKDLWEKNYYITSGTKFGGDFLAYEGDPLKYHALFVVVCMSEEERFQGHDLVVYGRLGNQVKKTVALASLNNDGKVDYISLSWENEMT